MTTLIKAATAYKKALAFEPVPHYLGVCAERIKLAAGLGQTKVTVYVPGDAGVGVAYKLELAGYTVEFDSSSCDCWPDFELVEPKPRNIWERIIFLIHPPKLEYRTIPPGPNLGSMLDISWEPVEELQDEPLPF
jgi:hypothetical protein